MMESFPSWEGLGVGLLMGVLEDQSGGLSPLPGQRESCPEIRAGKFF